MAGRKSKNTVEYFPHYCTSGKTMFIIESKYGNDGYAAWFKVLEVLGATENHYYDCRPPENWEWLQAKTKVFDDKLYKILDTLAGLDAISNDLWKHKVIWSLKFVDNIADAYSRRSNTFLDYDEICMNLGIQPAATPPPKVVAPTWRTDYKIYLNDCRKAYQQVVSDDKFRKEQMELNTGVDIELTLKKACINFWSTEAGWSYKKKKRTKDIDWISTFKNALSQKMNRVYVRDDEVVKKRTKL
jgi:hypothetical protein